MYVKTPYNNGNSTHTRLSLGWHTGVEIGGNPAYGGTRFFADSPGVNSNEIMSIGRGDTNIRISNTLYVPYIVDRDNGGYYIDMNGSSYMNTLTMANTIYSYNWFRSYNATGWYNESYGGGWFMSDSTWLRTYNGKNIYCDSYIRAQGSFRVGSEYSIWGNYGSYSSYISRLAYVSFDWNATYDTFNNHGYASQDYNANWADSVSLNSFNDITSRVDANNNNTYSYLRLMDNSTGDNTFTYMSGENGNPIAYFYNRMYSGVMYNRYDSSKYLDRYTGDYTSWYMGGSNNGYSGWRVDGSMALMIHTAGAGAPCGFWHPSYGWSFLSYCNGNVYLAYAAGWRAYTTDWGFYISGDLRASGNVIAYYSDIRLKENIETIPNALEKIQKLRGVTYDWNDEKVNINSKRAGTRDIGLIAQEVEAVEPLLTTEYQTQLTHQDSKNAMDAVDFVPEMSPMYKTIKYDKITALLVEAVKELKAELDEARAEIRELKNKN